MTTIARLLLPTCFLLVMIAFVQKFQAGPPPPTTRETVAELGFDIPPQGVVALEVITASCLPTVADGSAEPRPCIPPRPATRSITNKDGSMCAYQAPDSSQIAICVDTLHKWPAERSQ